MGLDDTLATDFANVFCNADDFAEVITYKPLHGEPVTISAVVDRLPPQFDPATGVAVHHITVAIANDETLGRTSISKEGDSVSVPRQRGGTAVDLRVTEILSQDAGGWTLLLR
ncbi:MAG TPA: hypothetical protein VGE74_23310 [Gemmata sp.]